MNTRSERVSAVHGSSFTIGATVAIVRIADGAVLATAKVDKVTGREVRTETPYEQRSHRNDVLRRYWRVEAPHAEIRVPREEKGTRAPCTIRIATAEDIASAQRRHGARRARATMPTLLRNKAEYEHQIEMAERRLQLTREPYEQLLQQIREDEALIASAPEE